MSRSRFKMSATIECGFSLERARKGYFSFLTTVSPSTLVKIA